MTDMEYRGWITVPGIDVESDDAGNLLQALEELHGSFGPVLSGTDEGVEVVLSVDEPDGDKAKARALMLGVVTDTLIFNGFGQHPSRIELERAEDTAAAR
jgi:hypothetical protein